MTFIDRHGSLIGDIEIPGVDTDEDDNEPLPGVVPVITDDIEIPVVDVEGPEAQDEVTAPKVEIVDLNIPHDDPSTIEVAPTQSKQAPETSETPAPVAPLAQEPGLRRSTRVRSQANQGYTPSMTCSKYSRAVTQLKSQGVLNPDAHMFVQKDLYQAEPNVVAAIMTQLSLKAGLKEWGDKSYTDSQSEMKQLNFMNTFKPKNWLELSQVQRQTVLESQMFLKQKWDGNIKGIIVAGGNKQHGYISKEDASSPTVADRRHRIGTTIMHHLCRGRTGRRSSGYPKRVRADAC
jgi:hypothetical protein